MDFNTPEPPIRPSLTDELISPASESLPYWKRFIYGVLSPNGLAWAGAYLWYYDRILHAPKPSSAGDPGALHGPIVVIAVFAVIAALGFCLAGAFLGAVIFSLASWRSRISSFLGGVVGMVIGVAVTMGGMTLFLLNFSAK